jgi:hypothetical protein
MARREGRAYKTFRAQVRITHATQQRPCALCGQPIDYLLAYPHPYCWSLDHIREVINGGAVFDPGNAQASHLRCNLRRGADTGNRRRGTRRTALTLTLKATRGPDL